jgi:hypothetical protein
MSGARAEGRETAVVRARRAPTQSDVRPGPACAEPGRPPSVDQLPAGASGAPSPLAVDPPVAGGAPGGGP